VRTTWNALQEHGKDVGGGVGGGLAGRGKKLSWDHAAGDVSQHLRTNNNGIKVSVVEFAKKNCKIDILFEFTD
jgi:hypothetical protein